MILVAGANGTVGRELLKQLEQNGAPARALVRDASRHSSLESMLVEVVEGDFARPETLQRALDGCDRAFLLSAMSENQVELQGNFIEACQHANVRHVVKLSSMGASPRSPLALGRWHGATEAQLEASGLMWTQLRPAYFMQNTFAWAQEIKRAARFSWPMGQSAVSWIHARDIAAVAARVLEDDSFNGKRLNITGGVALSGNEVAEELSRVLEKPIAYCDISLDEYRENLLQSGQTPTVANALTELHRVLAQGHGALITQDVEQVTGKAPISFAEFARENATLFRS